MPQLRRLSQDAFSNWPAFERELRQSLAGYDAAAVDRVIAKTVKARTALLTPQAALRNFFAPGVAEQYLVATENFGNAARFETWEQDQQPMQQKMLAALVESFIALETTSEP